METKPDLYGEHFSQENEGVNILKMKRVVVSLYASKFEGENGNLKGYKRNWRNQS
jgi:hypothetical protein